MVTSGWLRPKYSGPAMAVLGGGGRSSPARRRASISALMRFSTCRHATRFRVEQQDIEGDSKDKRLWLGHCCRWGVSQLSAGPQTSADTPYGRLRAAGG